MAQLLSTESPRTHAGLQEQRHVTAAPLVSAISANSRPAATPLKAVHPDAAHGEVPCDRDCPYCWGPETD